MDDTIEEISEELLDEIRGLLELKLAEFGVSEERQEWTKVEVSSKLITMLENNLITES